MALGRQSHGTSVGHSMWYVVALGLAEMTEARTGIGLGLYRKAETTEMGPVGE